MNTDHAANCALDSQTGWERKDLDALWQSSKTHANIRICLDGPRRKNGQSSSGMAIIAYQKDDGPSLLFRASACFGDLGSAFLAEALAMECALEVVFAFMGIRRA